MLAAVIVIFGVGLSTAATTTPGTWSCFIPCHCKSKLLTFSSSLYHGFTIKNLEWMHLRLVELRSWAHVPAVRATKKVSIWHYLFRSAWQTLPPTSTRKVGNPYSSWGCSKYYRSVHAAPIPTLLWIIFVWKVTDYIPRLHCCCKAHVQDGNIMPTHVRCWLCTGRLDPLQAWLWKWWMFSEWLWELWAFRTKHTNLWVGMSMEFLRTDPQGSCVFSLTALFLAHGLCAPPSLVLWPFQGFCELADILL